MYVLTGSYSTFSINIVSQKQAENKIFAQIFCHYIGKQIHQHWSLTSVMVLPTQKNINQHIWYPEAVRKFIIRPSV